MIRVISAADPGYTRTVRSLAWAEERARRVALLAGTAEIQHREKSGAEWTVLSRFTKTGSRVARSSSSEGAAG